jgi:hypothetical protein
VLTALVWDTLLHRLVLSTLGNDTWQHCGTTCLAPLPQVLDKACSFLALANIGLQMVGMGWALVLQVRPLDKAVAFLRSERVEQVRLVLSSTVQNFTSAASSAYGKLAQGSSRWRASAGGCLAGPAPSLSLDTRQLQQLQTACG